MYYNIDGGWTTDLTCRLCQNFNLISSGFCIKCLTIGLEANLIRNKLICDNIIPESADQINGKYYLSRQTFHKMIIVIESISDNQLGKGF